MSATNQGHVSDTPGSSAIRMRDVLLTIGFVPDPAVVADSPDGLSLRCRSSRISASFVINRMMRPIVLLGGVVGDGRSLALVECELPREVNSTDEGVAWVVYCLDSQAGGYFECPETEEWFIRGRANRHLLPWERERAAHLAAPRCYVQRDWVRLALRTLSQGIESSAPDTAITLQFDGEVLTMRCGTTLVAMPATGERWPTRFAIRKENLWPLPTRLRPELVEFAVQDSRLMIGSRGFSGIVKLVDE